MKKKECKFIQHNDFAPINPYLNADLCKEFIFFHLYLKNFVKSIDERQKKRKRKKGGGGGKKENEKKEKDKGKKKKE
ncbi:hypothetical protein, partial [Listeria monocytogenes]|uniref:hypothetical protein n=1 Tax=Listeria monocytogenes TaxID=1639 RepID=UPI000BE71FF4